MVKTKQLDTVKAALKQALEMTETLLTGFPIPGAKGMIATVLDIIKEVEVCAKIQPCFYHLYHQCRERLSTQNSVMN